MKNIVFPFAWRRDGVKQVGEARDTFRSQAHLFSSETERAGPRKPGSFCFSYPGSRWVKAHDAMITLRL